MKKRVIYLVILLLILNTISGFEYELSSFPSECDSLAKVSVSLEKNKLQLGEEIKGHIFIGNLIKTTPAVYTIKLYKDNLIAWQTTIYKNAFPGNNTYKLYQLIGFIPKIPVNSEGILNLGMNVQIGDKCLYRTNNEIETFSCNDGIKNGDEEGIDCGDSCFIECDKSISFPHQLIFNKGYYIVEGSGEWIEVPIKSISGIKTFKGGKWISGEGISFFGLPKKTSSVSAYGCCCMQCDESNYLFSCDFLTKGRYLLDRVGIWSCGWNII